MDFNERCYNLVSRIPTGKLSTYKEIATALHSKNYRGVGKAMKLNLNYSKIPCHRVIKTNGDIGGYNQGELKKKELLILEGHKIKDNKILDFKKKLFYF